MDFKPKSASRQFTVVSRTFLGIALVTAALVLTREETSEFETTSLTAFLAAAFSFTLCAYVSKKSEILRDSREDALRTSYGAIESAMMKRAEALTLANLEVSKKELNLRSLLMSTSEGILTVDFGGTIVSWNKGAEVMFGYLETEAIGRHFSVLLNSKFHQHRLSDYARDFDSTHQKASVEMTGRHKNGSEFSIEMTVGKWNAGDGTFMTCIIRDITERRKTEQSLKEQEAKIVAASRTSSLGIMASGVAHEINNPLAILRLKVESLRDVFASGKFEPSAGAAICNHMDETIDRISKIVSGLRAFARDATLDPVQAMSVKNLIEDTTLFCNERFRLFSVRLEVPAIDENLAIECRHIELSQALMNLLNNAFDAVSTLTDKWIRLEIEDKGDQILISVINAGDPVSEDIREKIFDPFFTTKAIGKGTGLGLSVARGLIENHEGTLFLDHHSQNPKFTIKLPKGGSHIEKSSAA
jgi:PAS domain S-box-containing protein